LNGLLRELCKAPSQEYTTLSDVNIFTWFVNHDLAHFAEQLDLILGKRPEMRQLIDLNDDHPWGKLLPELCHFDTVSFEIFQENASQFVEA
jgi:hypothetical protein